MSFLTISLSEDLKLVPRKTINIASSREVLPLPLDPVISVVLSLKFIEKSL